MIAILKRGKMTQESNNPINLAVHESADPSQIRNLNQEASADSKDLNDSVHDENVDAPNLGLLDSSNDENPVDSQITIANLGAG